MKVVAYLFPWYLPICVYTWNNFLNSSLSSFWDQWIPNYFECSQTNVRSIITSFLKNSELALVCVGLTKQPFYESPIHNYLSNVILLIWSSTAVGNRYKNIGKVINLHCKFDSFINSHKTSCDSNIYWTEDGSFITFDYNFYYTELYVILEFLHAFQQ